MYMVSTQLFLLEICSLPVRLALTPYPVNVSRTDERNIPPLNRIGDPDDILASVRVENGKVGS
jgi:hypothetical protein